MGKTALCVATILLACVLGRAQQYKVLYNFGSGATDGRVPIYNPVRDSAGNLYGVTLTGGISGTCFGGGCGTVFELSPNGHGGWSETVLHHFCEGYSGFNCPDGGLPNALIIDSSGNLYGTTQFGGLIMHDNGWCTDGCGVAYELSPPSSPGAAWTYTLLHNFCSQDQDLFCDDGAIPQGQLTLDASGNLYGTAADGGPNNLGNGGLVFELSRDHSGWTESTIYNFCATPGEFFGCDDGSFPASGVTFDASGNLYGTTYFGGSTTENTGGAIFKLSPGVGGWTETILHVFAPIKHFPDQSVHPGPTTIDPAGNLYTSAELGGKYKIVVEGNGAPGNLFQIDSAGKETVLYNFCSRPKCLDGSAPGGLYEDASGKFFGVALNGGKNGIELGGYGVMFEIIP
jgi:uncharacterized repeat protein (TIGR03803 family)